MGEDSPGSVHMVVTFLSANATHHGLTKVRAVEAAGLPVLSGKNKNVSCTLQLRSEVYTTDGGNQ